MKEISPSTLATNKAADVSTAQVPRSDISNHSLLSCANARPSSNVFVFMEPIMPASRMRSLSGLSLRAGAS